MPWSDEDFAKLSRPTRNAARQGGEAGHNGRANTASDGPDTLGPQSWAAFEPRVAPGPGVERNAARRQPSWWERLAESGPAQTVAGVTISIAAFAGLLAALFWSADDPAPDRAGRLPGLEERSVETRDPQGVVPGTPPRATARSESDSVLDQRPDYPAGSRTEPPRSTANAETNSTDNPVTADALSALAPEAGNARRPDGGSDDGPRKATKSPAAPSPSPPPSTAKTRPEGPKERTAEPAAPKRREAPVASSEPLQQPPPQPPVSHGPTRLTPLRPSAPEHAPPMIASVPPDTGRSGRPNSAGEAVVAPPKRRTWDEPIRRTLEKIEHAEAIATRPVRAVPQEAGPLDASQAPSAAYGGGAEPGSIPVIHGQEDLVRLVQRALDRLGYAPGDIDGQLGTQTRRAIVRYQVDRGLLPNGWVDQTLVGRVLAESRAKGRMTTQP